MTVQSYCNYHDDSKLVWLCKMCLFLNFSTTFLSGADFSSDNSFESLASEGDSPSRPLHTSSTSSVSAHHQERRKSTKRKLKFLSMNCNGLKSNSKKASFTSMIDLHQPDVILGCETKIDPSVSTYSIFPDTYEIYRKDRSLSGGGVFIAVRKSLIALEESLFDTNGCEIIGVSIQLASLKKLFTASYYTPPSGHPLSLHLLDDFLSKLFSSASFPRLILGGDFNCSGIDWSCDWPTPQCLRASPLRSLWQIWSISACSLTNSTILRPPIRPGFCSTSHSHPGVPCCAWY